MLYNTVMLYNIRYHSPKEKKISIPLTLLKKNNHITRSPFLTKPYNILYAQWWSHYSSHVAGYQTIDSIWGVNIRITSCLYTLMSHTVNSYYNTIECRYGAAQYRLTWCIKRMPNIWYIYKFDCQRQCQNLENSLLAGFMVILDVYRFFISYQTAFSKYYFTHWIWKLPRNFEIDWVRLDLVNFTSPADIVNTPV